MPVAPAPEASAAAPGGTFALYRELWRYADGARLQYAGAMLLLTLSVVVKLAIPWLAAQAINAVQVSGTAALAHAGGYVAMIFGVAAAAWALHGPGRILERNVGLRVRRNVSDALFTKLAALPLAWHERQHSGDVQQRAQQASRALFDFTQNQFIYVQSAVNIIGPLVALWLLSGTIGGLALAGFVAIAVVVVRFDRALMRLAVRENDTERRYTSRLLDLLGNISTVLSLRLQAASRALLGQRLEETFQPLKRTIVLNEAKWCAVELLSVVLTWVLVVAYVVLSLRGNGTGAGASLLLGGLFMIYQYAQQAGSVIGSIAGNFQGFARMRTDFASANLIWSAVIPEPAHVAITPGWTTIEARALRYTYTSNTESEPGGLHGVFDASLTLRRGERIALIGTSGSGKSTLLRVLAGLYTPANGHYQVDGAAGFGLRSLSSIATLVPQDTEAFEASVRDNLAFGVPRSEQAMAQALYLSAFDAVVAALPEGLDTPVTERGSNLSGGQRQRMALARGFLAACADDDHGSLLLLDEPTSALDQVTEARIFRRLRERLPDACVVASIHRMSALDQFDTVVLMHEGRVIDSGTADALLARQPLMRQLLQGDATLQGAA